MIADEAGLMIAEVGLIPHSLIRRPQHSLV